MPTRLTAAQVRGLLSAECAKCGSVKAWASTAGVSAQYAGEVLNGRREPGASILKALGLIKIVEYQRHV